MKKNSFNSYKEILPSDSFEEVIDSDTGQAVEERPQTKKYPNAKTIFVLFGNYPANWKINKTQLMSAENLFAERGAEQVMKALKFYKENKEEDFCPVINSPYDLDSKWAKLGGFKRKQ